MKEALKLCCVFMFLMSIAGAAKSSAPGESGRKIYRHAYYLFLAGTPRGCEECYIPLLVTSETLEEAARGTGEEACVLITTYERDSIWHNDGIVLVAPRNIEVTTRVIGLRDRKYRYQEISAAEALRLFTKPMGTIPISRPMLPRADLPGPTLEDLILDFRNLQ